ncbi:hypothetical protein BH24ACT26_BH24ACT26_11360 [soil metagenome]
MKLENKTSPTRPTSRPSDRLDSDETAQDNADRAAAQIDELHENVKRARDDVQDQD